MTVSRQRFPAHNSSACHGVAVGGDQPPIARATESSEDLRSDGGPGDAWPCSAQRLRQEQHPAPDPPALDSPTAASCSASALTACDRARVRWRMGFRATRIRAWPGPFRWGWRSAASPMRHHRPRPRCRCFEAAASSVAAPKAATPISSGARQRVALARPCCGRPQVFLLDETDEQTLDAAAAAEELRPSCARPSDGGGAPVVLRHLTSNDSHGGIADRIACSIAGPPAAVRHGSRALPPGPARCLWPVHRSAQITCSKNHGPPAWPCGARTLHARAGRWDCGWVVSREWQGAQPVKLQLDTAAAHPALGRDGGREAWRCVRIGLGAHKLSIDLRAAAL